MDFKQFYFSPDRRVNRKQLVGVMEILLFWLGLSVIVGVAANTRGRNGVGWFFISILISPLLAGLLVLALPRIETQAQLDKRNMRPCPLCAEPIRMEARLCPHCRSEVSPVDPRFAKEYPEMHNGVRYRRERDGSVVMATPTGPLRFKNWQEFWNAIQGRGAAR